MAGQTPRQLIRDALEPLVENPDWWTLHVPMYPNTFCLAYHLAALFAEREERDRLNLNFVNDEWWRGHPTFMYRTDIELFVAVKPTIEKLRARGHSRLLEIPFTDYAQAHVFVRRDRERNSALPYIVTDIPQTVELLKQEWLETPPPWLSAWNSGDISALPVRNAWSRNIGDLFDNRPKLYVFSAPMTQLLYARSIGTAPKYDMLDAIAAPIPTYYVMRCNSDASLRHIRVIKRAISSYYRIMFDPQLAIEVINLRMAETYAQMAMTSGQPNPFPEVYPGAPLKNPLDEEALVCRYAGILSRHHRPVGGL